MNISIISTELALSIILKEDSDFNYIKDLIIDSEEVDITNEGYTICYVNGNDLSNNVYTDIRKNSELKWIYANDGDVSLGFQLAYFGNDTIEFICIEKNNSLLYDINLFDHIVSYVRTTFNKPIVTYPLNEKLKSYYIGHGFKEYENGFLIYK